MTKQDRKLQDKKELEQERKAILAAIKETGFAPNSRNLLQRLKKVEARLRDVA